MNDKRQLVSGDLVYLGHGDVAYRHSRIAEAAGEGKRRWKLTPEAFQAEMQRLSEIDDEESRHCAADDLMCSVLEELGYREGVEVFQKMEKWYA